MKIREIITEGLNHPVIVVDVQPEYAHSNAQRCADIIKFVNKQTGPVLMFVNAEDTGVSEDTIDSIREYWDNTICPEEERMTYDEEYDDYVPNPNCDQINWNRFTIVDKGYGYFRSWLDSGINESIIVATIRELYSQKVNDTRMLEFPEPNKRTKQQNLIATTIEEMDGDPLITEWTSVAQLKRFNGAYIVGGGRNKCLREVELLMNAFNIKYKRIDSLVY